MRNEWKEKKLFAGAGKADIEIPLDFFPQEDFSEVAEPLHARTLILDLNKRFVIVSLELTSIPDKEVQLLKKIVHEITGAEDELIWICVTHSFSSPHFLPPFLLKDEKEIKKIELFRSAMQEAVIRSVETACDKLCEAELKIGSSECNINCNRDIETDSGWWIGQNPNGISDKKVQVIGVYEKGFEKALALLFHYNMQSSVMDGIRREDNTRVVTPDVVGKASAYLESESEDMVAIFLFGAAGDQCPIQKGKNIKECMKLIDEFGKQLSNSVVNATKEMNAVDPVEVLYKKINFTCQEQIIPKDIHSLRPDKNYKYEIQGERDMSIEGLSLGNILLLATKPELNSSTAYKIQENNEVYEHCMILTMVNGAAKYMADYASYEKRTYEAMNSFFAQGSAEILEKNADILIGEFKNIILMEEKNDY